jgi:hypothetical protein
MESFSLCSRLPHSVNYCSTWQQRRHSGVHALLLVKGATQQELRRATLEITNHHEALRTLQPQVCQPHPNSLSHSQDDKCVVVTEIARSEMSKGAQRVESVQVQLQ